MVWGNLASLTDSLEDIWPQRSNSFALQLASVIMISLTPTHWPYQLTTITRPCYATTRSFDHQTTFGIASSVPIYAVDETLLCFWPLLSQFIRATSCPRDYTPPPHLTHLISWPFRSFRPFQRWKRQFIMQWRMGDIVIYMRTMIILNVY